MPWLRERVSARKHIIEREPLPLLFSAAPLASKLGWATQRECRGARPSGQEGSGRHHPAQAPGQTTHAAVRLKKQKENERGARARWGLV